MLFTLLMDVERLIECIYNWDVFTKEMAIANSPNVDIHQNFQVEYWISVVLIAFS